MDVRCLDQAWGSFTDFRKKTASAYDRAAHGSQFIPTVLKSDANCGAQAVRAIGCI